MIFNYCRLPLQGLDPESDYELWEPVPNNITQAQGTLMMIETEGKLMTCMISCPSFKKKWMICSSCLSTGSSQCGTSRQHLDDSWFTR